MGVFCTPIVRNSTICLKLISIFLEGERQSVCFARAIVRKSKIYLLVISILVWAIIRWCVLRALSMERVKFGFIMFPFSVCSTSVCALYTLVLGRVKFTFI